MGSNDHVPVPDPKPRPPEARVLVEVEGKDTVLVGGPTTSNERLDNLEKSRERHDAQVVSFLTSLTNLSGAIVRLERLLRQTSRGVERLAQGHSQGNLGLPTDEDWASHDTTL